MLNSSIKFSEHLYNPYVEIVEWVVENISAAITLKIILYNRRLMTMVYDLSGSRFQNNNVAILY